MSLSEKIPTKTPQSPSPSMYVQSTPSLLSLSLPGTLSITKILQDNFLPITENTGNKTILMARSLSVSVTKTYYLTSSPSPTRCSSRLLTLRAQSNVPNRNNQSESDDSSSSSSTDPLLRKLEDAIHGIIVRRAAPDWLPFLPGSSYWVPPPRSASGSLGIAHLVEKLANPLSDEESLSTSTVRGWPSSDYFVKGNFFFSYKVLWCGFCSKLSIAQLVVVSLVMGMQNWVFLC